MRDEAETASAGWRRFTYAPLLLGALAGLALCALAYVTLTVFTPRQPDITPTARAICADLTTQRYADLYARLDPALRAQGTEAQFAASQRELDQLKGAVTACSTTSARISSGAASLTLSLTRSGAHQPTSAQATLTSDGGAWRITAYSGAF
jgi:hypothetical protein